MAALKNRSELLIFYVVFNAVQMCREQAEAQTPPPGDTAYHCCAGNRIQSWPLGVSVRQNVNTSRYPYMYPGQEGWPGPTARRKPVSPTACYFKLQPSAQLACSTRVPGAGTLLCRWSCGNSPKSTCRI